MADQVNAPTAAEYGGFWIRFLAVLVDSAILILAGTALMIALTLALGPTGGTIGFIIYGVATLLYWPIMHASARQATFGKAMVGLKVTDYAGNRISILRALMRDPVGKFISSIPLMLGFLVAAFTARKQALHDLIASTYVVREGPSHVGRALAVAVAGYVLPVVMIPLLIGGAMMGMMAGMMGGMAKPEPAPAPAAKVAKATPSVAKSAPTPPAAKPAPPVTQQAAPPVPPVAVAPAPAVPKPVAAPAIAPAPKPAVPAAVEAVKREPAKKSAPREETAASEPAPETAMGRTVAMAAPPAFSAGPVVSPGFNDLMTAVLYRDAAGVNELLALGKWPDKPDERGTTPLMAAVMLGDAASAEALLKAGADPNLGARNGSTAASLARERSDGAMTALLKRYGAR